LGERKKKRRDHEKLEDLIKGAVDKLKKEKAHNNGFGVKSKASIQILVVQKLTEKKEKD